MVALPSQNQLYALYVSRCGFHGVGKPNRRVLELLLEDSCSRDERLTKDAAALVVDHEDLGTMDEYTVSPEPVVPLARKTSLVVRPGPGEDSVYVGARGMLPLLDVIATLPLLEELDLSTIGSWFASDFAQDAVTGNDVVARLCSVCRLLPSLRLVDITGQPVGSRAASDLVTLLAANRRITALRYTADAVDGRIVDAIRRQLENNGHQKDDDPLLLPESLPPSLLALPVLDRKLVRQQQLLRKLLQEDGCFSGLLSAEEIDQLVLHARTMSTTQVITRSPLGLRGDGEHLYLLGSGAIRAMVDLEGIVLSRGDYFGDCYDATITFPPCRLQEVERGTVFCLPLEHCEVFMRHWTVRVAEFFPRFQKLALLQPTDLWTRVRVSTCAVLQEYAPGAVVTPAGDHTPELFVVERGYFLGLPGDETAQEITGRRYAFEFYPDDLIGAESVVSLKRCTSVDVIAAKERDVHYSLLRVQGSAVRLLVARLRPVLVSLARSYTVHADMRVEVPVRGEAHDDLASLMYYI